MTGERDIWKDIFGLTDDVKLDTDLVFGTFGFLSGKFNFCVKSVLLFGEKLLDSLEF